MFSRSPTPSGGAGGGSPLTKCLAALGTAGGISGTILLTPALYGLSAGWLSSYLASSWGPIWSSILTPAMGVVWALIIYNTIKMLVISGITAAIVALASRSAPHS